MKLSLRKIAAIILVLSITVSLPSFIDHYLFFITGQVNAVLIQGQWEIAALSIAGFLLFLIPLKYRRKADWKSYSIYTAFIVSLFIEMYGIPLSIFLTTPLLTSTATEPAYFLSFDLLAHHFDMTFWMVIGALITILGALTVIIGWINIYLSKNELVTRGIYSISRHPQYIGISLIAVGWFIGWPTLLTTAMLPILIYIYRDAAIKEEKEVAAEIGEEKYQEYAKQTPRFL